MKKSIINKVAEHVYNSFTNECEVLVALEPIQEVIDDLLAQETTYMEIAGHYLTLNFFNEAEKYGRMSDRAGERVQRILKQIKEHRQGHFILYHLNY